MMDVVVIPTTGEAVDLSGPLEKLADAFDELGQLDRDLRTAKREISDEVARRLDHEGRRSIEVDGYKIEVTAPTEKQWDLDELRATLAELQGEGTISDVKARACLKFEPKPVWSELKTLLSDPRCQARLAHCFSEVPAHRYAKVRRA